MEIYDVFISYRRSDGMKYAEELNTALTNGGLRVFFDKDKLDSGKAFPEQLEYAVKAAPHYILIGSPDAFVDRSIDNPGEIDFVREEMKLACEYDTDERSIHVLQLPGVDYEEQKGKASDSIKRIFDSTWLEYNDNNKQKVYEEITEISRQNIWYAASRWYGDSKKPGARFHSIDITDTLLPVVDTQKGGKELQINVHGENEGESVPLLDAIGKENGHIYLIGEGGIGKTTSLMRIMQESYEDKVYSDDVQIPVFVELSFAPDSNYGKIYEGGGSTFIRRMIFRQIRNIVNLKQVSDEQIEDLNEVFSLPKKLAVDPVNEVFRFNHGLPKFLLLLDGLNEVSQVRINDDEHGNPSVYSMVVDEIKELAGFDNVQIILTSRMDESAIDKGSLSKLYLSGINDESICGYLGIADDKKYAFLAQKELVDTLRNPLFLTMYSKLANARDITTRGEIMKEYFGERSGANYTQLSRLEKTGNDVKEFSDKSLKKRISYEMYKFILDFILPEIAWKLERENEFYINKIKFKRAAEHLLTDRDDQSVCGDYGQEAFTAFKSSSAGDHTGSVADKLYALDDDFSKVNEQILDICTNTLGILQVTDGKYGFIHQHIRDYFAAVKNINMLTLASFMNEEGEKKFALECMNGIFKDEPVGITVRQFMGEYLGEHRNKPFFDNGKWNYSVPAEKCDRNLLERSLDIYRGLFNGETGYGIYSLIQVLKETRDDLSGMDFSDLDLTLCSLNGHRLSQPGVISDFKGAKLNGDSVFPIGHAEWVASASFSPDGDMIVTASWDKTAKLWDVKTGKCLKTLEGHTGWIYSASFSPDGKTVVTASYDKTAKLWDVETGKCIMTLEGHTGEVYSAAFSPDGKTIVTASGDCTAKLWDVETGKCIMTLGHKFSVYSALFSPDGKTVVTASINYTAKLWNAETGKCIKTLEGHTGVDCFASFSPDAKMVVTASDDNTAKLWDVETGNCIMTLEGHNGKVNFASFNTDGNMIVTASWDKTAKLWDTETGKYIMTLEGHTDMVRSTSFSPDGKIVVTASRDNTAKLWDVETGKCINTLEGHKSYVTSALFSPDGKTVVTTPWDDTAKLWDVKTGKCIHTLEGHTKRITSALFSPDGKTVVTASLDETAKLWDVETGNCIMTLEGHTNRVNSASFSPDGKTVVTASNDQTSKLWDVRTGKCINTFEGHDSSVLSASFSSDGKTVVTASYDKTAKLWDTETGKYIMTLEGHVGWVYSASFSPDGKTVVTASDDKTAKIWDAKTGKCINTLEGHAKYVNSASFSPDGKMVVTASNDKTAKLWDVETGECIMTLEGHTRLVYSAVFSPDGKMIVTKSQDKTAKIWDVETGKCIQTLDGYPNQFASASFSPDGKMVVTASFGGGIVKLWSIGRDRNTFTLAEAKRMIENGTLKSPADTAAGFDCRCVATLENVPGLIVNGCDFTKLYPASSFSEREIKLLEQYGAIV